MIEFSNVTKTYITGNIEYQALHGIDLKIEQSELTAIIGASGSGKSTAMNIMGLLDRPTTGTYHFKGIDISHYNRKQLAKFRNLDIGFVFQSYFLLSKLTAQENAALPLLYQKHTSKERRIRSSEALERVGLKEHLHHRPGEMSGGQKQRVAIARALVTRPNIIFADEPTGALDTQASDNILNLLVDLHQTEKTTIVVVTHDPHVAKSCNRIITTTDALVVSDILNKKNKK